MERLLGSDFNEIAFVSLIKYINVHAFCNNHFGGLISGTEMKERHHDEREFRYCFYQYKNIFFNHYAYSGLNRITVIKCGNALSLLY